MAKRRAYLHVGLDDGSGDIVSSALDTHAHALLDLRVRRPDDALSTYRAVVDVLGLDHEWGYTRDEVDGAWDSLVERARKGRDTIVISQSLLARADTDRARRVVSALDGFDVHAVVTARAPEPLAGVGDPGRDLTEVLPAWSRAVGAEDRVHVLLGDAATTWKSLGRVAGFGTASLRVNSDPTTSTATTVVDPEVAAAWRAILGSSSYDVVGDLTVLEGAPMPDEQSPAELALAEARAELARLRHRTADLEQRLAKAEKKKRKLKRRLNELG